MPQKREGPESLSRVLSHRAPTTASRQPRDATALSAGSDRHKEPAQVIDGSSQGLTGAAEVALTRLGAHLLVTGRHVPLGLNKGC